MTRFAQVSATTSLAASLLLSAGIAAADSIPASTPKPSDVATLRELLALQYPLLRKRSASTASPGIDPSITVEPDRSGTKAPESEPGA